MVCLQRIAGAYSREAGGESGGAAASMTCLGEETPPSHGPLLTNGAKNLFTNRIADSRPLSRHRQYQHSHRRYSALPCLRPGAAGTAWFQTTLGFGKSEQGAQTPHSLLCELPATSYRLPGSSRPMCTRGGHGLLWRLCASQPGHSP
jgi:hypothetical protein